MEDGVKGTITPLSSLFSVEEAQKAAKRVQDTISERQEGLDRLRLFIADNTNLINLVQKLPDDLSHDIMVPFGKAAFFPGRLIHTNELLVFLGEGYHADRTAKQTVEILQRREKALESQVEALKAMMLDLQAEANFFDSAAVEAAEGLVEIREEYIEKPQAVKKVGTSSSDSTAISSFKVDNAEVVTEDEDARIMARLDELEKEELAAAAKDEEDAQIVTGLDEHDEEELAAAAEGEENIQMIARVRELAAASAFSMDDHDVDEALFKPSRPQHSFKDLDFKISTEEHLRDLAKKSREKYLSPTPAAQPSGNGLQKDLSDLSSFEGLKRQYGAKDDSVRSKISEYTTQQTHSAGRPPLHTEPEEKVHEVPMPKLKAFTGSIIEHSHGLSSNLSSSISSTQASNSNPSKPVSRFKMQKGSR